MGGGCKLLNMHPVSFSYKLKVISYLHRNFFRCNRKRQRTFVISRKEGVVLKGMALLYSVIIHVASGLDLLRVWISE